MKVPFKQSYEVIDLIGGYAVALSNHREIVSFYDTLLDVTCLVFSSQFHLETLAPVVDSDFHCDTNSSGVWYSRLEWGRTAL